MKGYIDQNFVSPNVVTNVLWVQILTCIGFYFLLIQTFFCWSFSVFSIWWCHHFWFDGQYRCFLVEFLCLRRGCLCWNQWCRFQFLALTKYEFSTGYSVWLQNNSFVHYFISTHNICFYDELQKNYPRIITKYSSFILVLLNKLVPRPLLIFSQSDYLIRIVAINSHT